MRELPEKDWRVFSKEIAPVALQRLCDRFLDKTLQLATDEAKSSHDRYLNVYRHIEKSDQELGQLFNNLRRSDAMIRLLNMIQTGLVTDAEMARFSDETIEFVRKFSKEFLS